MPRDCSPLLAALADELDAARRDLEALAATLCADPDIVLRHLGALQTIDEVGQRQAVAAAILRAPDPLAAAAAVPLEAVRRRLSPVLDHIAA